MLAADEKAEKKKKWIGEKSKAASYIRPLWDKCANQGYTGCCQSFYAIKSSTKIRILQKKMVPFEPSCTGSSLFTFRWIYWVTRTVKCWMHSTVHRNWKCICCGQLNNLLPYRQWAYKQLFFSSWPVIVPGASLYWQFASSWRQCLRAMRLLFQKHKKPTITIIWEWVDHESCLWEVLPNNTWDVRFVPTVPPFGQKSIENRPKNGRSKTAPMLRKSRMSDVR